MIGKAKSISHTKASIQYGWNEEKDAKIVFRQNLIGDNPKEITEEFKTIQAMNYRCKRNTISFVLSPTIEDGLKLSLKAMKIITSEFINELKLKNHQAIAFVHDDKKHKHIHLYVNRISFNGKAYNDSFIGKRAQKASEAVALKFGLKTVKQVQEEKLESVKDIRKFIKQQHENCIQFAILDNFEAYIKAMKTHNIQVKPVINKSNSLQGFRYEFNSVSLKGSEVHRSMSINKFKLAISTIKKSINKPKMSI